MLNINLKEKKTLFMLLFLNIIFIAINAFMRYKKYKCNSSKDSIKASNGSDELTVDSILDRIIKK